MGSVIARQVWAERCCASLQRATQRGDTAGLGGRGGQVCLQRCCCCAASKRQSACCAGGCVLQERRSRICCISHRRWHRSICRWQVFLQSTEQRNGADMSVASAFWRQSFVHCGAQSEAGCAWAVGKSARQPSKIQRAVRIHSPTRCRETRAAKKKAESP